MRSVSSFDRRHVLDEQYVKVEQLLLALPQHVIPGSKSMQASKHSWPTVPESTTSFLWVKYMLWPALFPLHRAVPEAAANAV